MGFKNKQARSVMTSPQAHPLVLHLILVELLTLDYVFWEPETVWKEIEYTLKVRPPKVNIQRIQALRSALSTIRCYTHWDVFAPVARSLGGDLPSFAWLSPLTPAQCAIGMNMLHYLAQSRKFSDEVVKYAAACCAYYGACCFRGLKDQPEVQRRLNKELAKITDVTTQKRVVSALQAGRKPEFDGNNELDIQVLHTRHLMRMVLADMKRMQRQVLSVGVLES